MSCLEMNQSFTASQSYMPKNQNMAILLMMEDPEAVDAHRARGGPAETERFRPYLKSMVEK